MKFYTKGNRVKNRMNAWSKSWKTRKKISLDLVVRANLVDHIKISVINAPPQERRRKCVLYKNTSKGLSLYIIRAGVTFRCRYGEGDHRRPRVKWNCRALALASPLKGAGLMVDWAAWRRTFQVRLHYEEPLIGGHWFCPVGDFLRLSFFFLLETAIPVETTRASWVEIVFRIVGRTIGDTH